MLVRRLFGLGVTAALAALVASAGCSGKKNTELVIAIQTDLRIPKDLNAVSLEIADQNGNQFMRQSFLVGPDGLHLPATIGVVANDPSNVIDVTVTGQFGDLYPDDKNNHGHVIRRARFSFAEGRTGLVQMPLRFACYDAKPCADGQACVAGACKVISVIDGHTLPEFTPEKVYGAGAGDNGVGGKCWDPKACLLASVTLTKSRDDTSTGECYFPIGGSSGGAGGSSGGAGGPSAGTRSLDTSKPLNVFMQTKNIGFCDSSGTCRVALDYDIEEGWHYDDSKTNVVLPAGLCAKVAGGAVVEASDACETKVPSVPLCSIDSAETVGGGPDGGASFDGGDVDASMGGDGGTSTDSSFPDAGPSDGSAPFDSGGPSCGLGPTSTPPISDPTLASFSLAGGVGTDSTGGAPLTVTGKPTGGTNPATCPLEFATFTGSESLTGSVPKLASTTNGFAISVWVRGVVNPSQTMVSTLTGSSGFELGTDASGHPTVSAMFNSGNVTVTGPNPLNDGWHHLVVFWQGVGQPMRLLVDGALAGAMAPAATALFQPSTTLTIGRSPTGSKYLTTQLGDVEFYGH